MTIKQDIVINQGTTFQYLVYLTDEAANPLNLSGYTATVQMKRWYSSISSYNIGATVNTTAGIITLALSPVESANIAQGRYVYDVILADASNIISRVVEGIVIVSPGVTNISIDTTPNTYIANVNFVVVPLLG